MSSNDKAPCLTKEPLTTAAIIPCQGIGDALLMLVASNTLKVAGIATTTFHPKLLELSQWFVGHTLEANYSLEQLGKFDLVIIENDNSKTVEELRNLAKSGHIKRLSIYYPTYKAGKHPPLTEDDQVFNASKPMAENVARATEALLNHKAGPHENGIIVLPDLTHRLYQERVVIHPTSSSEEKNWSPFRFQKLAKKLKTRGFHPVLSLSPEELHNPTWKQTDIETPIFSTLSKLAAYLYESGYVIGNDSLIGHLASNLNIPTIIIANCQERIRLWRPGWLKGTVLTPPRWIPNHKPFRLRSKHWRTWIRVRDVMRAFTTLTYRS